MLVANRGEIAIRIMRTLREMNIESVAVYSDAEPHAQHVQCATTSVGIGPAPASDSYLRIDRILEAAKKSGADAIHPGYGFLSEKDAFAQAVVDAGLTFIGPPAAAMRIMGTKLSGRAKMEAAGVPIVPGGEAKTLSEAYATAERIGYPVMIKASSGGGGKGMRLVHAKGELQGALERASSEASRSFSDATVYLEKAIVNPRHIEIQVLGDQHGNVIHLFERDCSIQRRHQKVIEETPCPVISRETVEAMGRVAVRGAQSVGYFSAGTFEFLLSETGEYYFMEMNTRLQVEHPITEWVTGVDLVREMVRVAQGEPLNRPQDTVQRRGAAIECRIYAEDADHGFLPSPGRIHHMRIPEGPFIRHDGGYVQGDEIPSHYDPMVAKLSVWAESRNAAIARMRRALADYELLGPTTNLDFHERVMAQPDFVAGNYTTDFIESHKAALCETRLDPRDINALALLAASKAHLDATRAGNAGPGNRPHGSPWVEQHRASLLR